MTTRRNFIHGMFAVAAGAAVPIDALTALVGQPTHLAPAMRDRYADVMARTVQRASALLADSITKNNALLQRLAERGHVTTKITFENGRVVGREIDL